MIMVVERAIGVVRLFGERYQALDLRISARPVRRGVLECAYPQGHRVGVYAASGLSCS